ncbi:MAG: glycoside hydrolase family 36 protein [Gemmatimonadota bacterium]|nr:glycoside hydrolase family 36 protein [Gemmatimonadota bacterium]
MQIKTKLSEDRLVVESGLIRLEINSRMNIKPSLLAEGGPYSIVSGQAQHKPAFHIKLAGLWVTGFRVDWNTLEEADIQENPGFGRRITFNALANQHGDELYPAIEVSARVSLCFYEQFPGLVVGSADFTNLGEQTLAIDRVVSNYYRLDRRLLSPELPAWRFASYQGAAQRWGQDYSLVWIENDTDRRNFMGTGELSGSGGEGGGTPLVDLWAPECGLAVASAETTPQWINLPVRTCSDTLVDVCVEQQPRERFGDKISLGPGETCSTIRSALILHQGDFHDPIRTYADMLRAQGVKIPETSPPAAYEPYWKTWGFGLDFTLGQIYGALDEIKGLGIETAVLDDGWFTWYGDWDPNPAAGKFPGGEADMTAFVRKMHAQGFKTGIWWYPLGVSPESRLFSEHPEWLIEDRDGGPRPACMRNLFYLCPECPEAVSFIEHLVEKFLLEWDFDYLYLDTTGLSASPPCFNPAHRHQSPLDSFRGQPKIFKAIYDKAQKLKPGCPVEMCICGIPHDPFKMPFYNLATTSDPVNLAQVRRRVKLEKAFRGPTFCVGDCYQIPMDEWEGWSVPDSFESAMGTGAQVTTLYEDLTPEQLERWRHWFRLYKQMGLSSGEYLNLYDIAFDKPEAHLVRKNGILYYGFFAERWSRVSPLTLRGLEPGTTYRVRDYANDSDLGTVSGDKPEIVRAFKEYLLLEVSPLS